MLLVSRLGSSECFIGKDILKILIDDISCQNIMDDFSVEDHSTREM